MRSYAKRKGVRVSDERPSGPFESFEVWLLRRVARAVEAGEMSAALLTELQAAFEAAQATPQEAAHTAAVRHVAEIAGVPEEQAAETLAAIEAQPEGIRDRLLRRIAEEWLEGQRESYRRCNPADWRVVSHRAGRDWLLRIDEISLDLQSGHRRGWLGCEKLRSS